MNETHEHADGRYRVEPADIDYWRRQINCQHACPVHTDARGYVRAIADGDYRRAYLIARGPNPLASICGRICGAPCEAACRRGDYDQPLAIRALKGFACTRHGPEKLLGELGRDQFLDQRVHAAGSGVCEAIDEIQRLLEAAEQHHSKRPSPEPRGTVAIIGAGPAGLACAHDLALMGFNAVIFEAEPVPAGMLYLGVPAYRLPRELIRAEIAVIEALGAEIRCNVEIGRDIQFSQLQHDYDAVVIAVGAKRSRALDLPGIDGPGVLGGIDFLRDVALERPPRLGQRVIVIGGGNVAYDVARTSLRQAYFDAARSAVRQPEVGEVHLACLESRAEMPADDIEVHEGDEEGIRRHNSLGPVGIVRDDDGRVSGVEFQRCTRVFDETGRFSPLFDPDDRRIIHADTVILSVGQAADFTFIDPEKTGVQLTDRGLVRIDPDTLQSTADNVYVTGDAAHGPRLMIDAIASGKQAARSIYRRLSGKTADPRVVEKHFVIAPYRREKGYEQQPRLPVPTADPRQRLEHPTLLVEQGYDETAARCEAGRCFDCGVNTIFDGEKCVLCGGCADVCPTLCLKLVGLEQLAREGLCGELIDTWLDGEAAGRNSAIIKDETCCIRCANCAERCPTGAITMERFTFSESWS
jgi:NADPH-dependent glutamate synthase beta subunit-like oxidoreductase/NAD-dependent dihydropyrimidine dehydrogenase PreA subunit